MPALRGLLFQDSVAVWSGCNGGRVGTCCPRVGVLGQPETRGHKCPPYADCCFRAVRRFGRVVMGVGWALAAHALVFWGSLKRVGINAHPTQIACFGQYGGWAGCNGGRVGTCCPRVWCFGQPETRGHECPPYADWCYGAAWKRGPIHASAKPVFQAA